MVLLAGCSGDKKEDTGPRFPTAIPPTPTLRSTPLPDVAQAPALGQGDRAITLQLAVLGSDIETRTRRAGTDLQRELGNALDLEIDVEFVDEDDALKALCSGAPHAAWVSAFTYMQAEQQCGAIATLAVQRGRAPEITVGRTAEIMARTQITDLVQMAGGYTFCRSADADLFTSWIFPGLLMSAAGVNPLTELDEVRDYPDTLSVARALYRGECSAAALPPDEFEDLMLDLSAALSTGSQTVTISDLEDVLHILEPAGNTTVTSATANFTGFKTNVIPYEVLVFPPDSVIPAELRAQMVTAITEFLKDRANGAERLDNLLDATGVFAVDPGDFTAFRAVIIGGGWNMTFVP